jgi:hypothetical protein
VTIPRQTVIGLTAGAILVVAIGVLWAVSTSGPNPDAIRAELEARIVELNAIPDTDPIRKEAFAKKLIDNEDYRKYARGILIKVERALPKLQAAAHLERAALKDVTPFLARCKEVTTLSPAALAALSDEARALLDTYGATRHADALRAAQKRVNEQLAADPPCTSTDVLNLGIAVQKALDKDKVDEARRLIEDFVKKRRGADQFKSQIDQLREKVNRRAGLRRP